MARKNKRIVIEKLLLTTYAAEGKSLGRHEDKVIFVNNAIPGDVVDVLIKKPKKSYSEGDAIQFHEYSSMRVPAFCEHFGTCGGCKWQYLDYPLQLKFKQQQVFDALTRIGGLELPEFNPIMPAPHTTEYRNKLEFTFSDKRWLTREEIQEVEAPERRALGFHLPGMFNRIVDIKHCYLQGGRSNELRNRVREFAIENDYSFYDADTKQGLLRVMMVRTANTGQWMVLIQFFEDDRPKINLLMEMIKEEFNPDSLLYVINPKGNDTLNDLEIMVYSGQPYIEEVMEGLRFRISAQSFFQTNSVQALELYKATRRMAGLTGTELVYDLYTGTGTIANFVAAGAREVVGVEYVEQAIVDAKENSTLNGVANTRFYAGDMKKVLNDEFIAKHGIPDVVITDPPRAGMDKEVVELLLKISPAKIVYVSCNPATQARDAALLAEKYKVTEVQPVDMFPHTHHVENIITMVRK